MVENEGINVRTLETFSWKIIQIRIAANGHFVTGKFVSVGEDLIIEKRNGKRKTIRMTGCAD